MGASPGRTLWSLDFWPKRQTDSICPGESICLQAGHSSHDISILPILTVPLKGPPWACSTRDSGIHLHLYLTWPSLAITLSLEAVLHSLGLWMPGHLLSAAWRQLPVCGQILCPCLHLTSARTYPPAQPVPSLCLLDFHLAPEAALCPWSVCCHHCFALA